VAQIHFDLQIGCWGYVHLASGDRTMDVEGKKTATDVISIPKTHFFKRKSRDYIHFTILKYIIEENLVSRLYHNK
jgi:hypothetical protein